MLCSLTALLWDPILDKLLDFAVYVELEYAKLKGKLCKYNHILEITETVVNTKLQLKHMKPSWFKSYSISVIMSWQLFAVVN